MSKFSYGLFMVTVMLVITSGAYASPLFSDAAMLDIKLAGPLNTLIKDKENSEELPFVLTANGVDHAVKVRVRGKSRLTVCRFPPLRINFTKRDTEGSVFAGQDKLKLVTPCKPGERPQQDILKEYAAYRIFNEISDVGYKVRPLRITYVDTDGQISFKETYKVGFFIESASELEARLNAQRVQISGVTLGSLDSQQAALVFIFQYLIANTDWSLVTADLDDECCHNGDLFEIGSKRFFVPYDFDLSGLVNARYAKPDPSIGISRVTKRRYRGYCIPDEALSDALNSITEKQSGILGVLDQIPELSEANKKTKQKFILAFFNQASNPAKLLRGFEKRCL